MTRTRIVLFLVLVAFWFVLSDQYTPLFVVMGLASAALVTWLTAPLLATVLGTERRQLSRLPLRLWHTGAYLGWLTYSVFSSAIQVAWIVINPRVPPEPRMLRFRTSLDSRLARVILANTISLVPGTLTVRLEGDEYLVHALVPAAAENLLDGSMQTRIARMFFEEGERAIEPRWEPAPEVGS
jgi:multicomponent Na+:H+ antiporter subunit E